MSDQQTRTDKVDRVEGESAEVLWGRVAFLVGEMLSNDDQPNLINSPRYLRHLLLRLPCEHELLERLTFLVSQINEGLGEESSDISFYYLLGFFRERKRQARRAA